MRYVVWTSDEHLAPNCRRGAWASRPEIRGDAERAMLYVDKWCREHSHLGIVRISGGDTLDSYEPEPDRMAWFQSYFRQHLESCRAYYYIQGQHDRVLRCPETPWLSVVSSDPKLRYMHQQVITIADRAFVFHDNAPAAELMQNLMKLTPADQPSVLVAHQLWHPWLPAGRPIPSLTHLPAAIKLVLTGDYHEQRQDYITCSDHHVLEAWSAGPLTVQEISGNPACRFLVIDLETWKVEAIPLPYRPIYRYEILTDEKLLEVLQAISRLAPHHDMTSVEVPIVQVKYLSSIPDVYRQVQDAARNKAHLFCDAFVQVETKSLSGLYSKLAKHDLNSAIEASGKAPEGSIERKILDEVLGSATPQDLEFKLNAIWAAQLEKQDEGRKADAAELLPASSS